MSPCRIGNAVDPTKCTLEQTRIELAVLNFHPGAEQVLLACCTD